LDKPSSEGLWGLSKQATACLKRARDGDVEAFGVVCLELEKALWSQAMMFSGDEGMAEDLVQEALIIAWRRLECFDGACRFLTWVTGILLNLRRNAARKKQPIPESQLKEQQAGSDDCEPPDSLGSQIVDPSQDPAEQVLRSEKESFIRTCFERLPEEQRRVVQLRFFAGAGIGEIAAVLGCPEGTVKSRLFHAVRKLSEMKELREALVGNELEKPI
jgi:RNA polymerase sigma-70 factor (ECF subfamily)